MPFDKIAAAASAFSVVACWWSSIIMLTSRCVLPVTGQSNATGQSTNQVVISNDKRLSKFKENLNRAGFSPSIGKTVFGPTNQAFDDFQQEDPDRYEKYFTKQEFFVHFQDLIEWNLVTQGTYQESEIFDGSRGYMENPQGNITIDQQFKTLDNINQDNIVDANMNTSDGVIHVVDKMILPWFLGEDMIAQLLNSRNFYTDLSLSNMANIILHVGLEDKINDPSPEGMTLLVPPNRRFNRAELDIPKMLSPAEFNNTRQWVLCHMIKGIYHEQRVWEMNEALDNDGQFLTTSELGTNIWITTTLPTSHSMEFEGERLMFQSQDILVKDQPSDNALFHVLDYPLEPPIITSFTFFTHLSTNHDTSDCRRFWTQCSITSADVAEEYGDNITEFCPTRDAFTRFNHEDYNRLLSPDWYRHACEFKFNHLTLGGWTRAELVAKAPSQIEMLNGERYNLRKSGDRPRIQNDLEEARSNFGDLIAMDGYLHTIDEVITPVAVSSSIYDRIQYNDDTTLMKINIDMVLLTDYISTDSPLTVLVPNNAAFERVEFGTVDGGPIINRHIFRGLFFCDKLANQTEVITVTNEVLGVKVETDENGVEELWVGGSKILDCDILAHNGLLHIMDRVIGLSFDSPAPSESPAPTKTPAPTTSYSPSLGPQALFEQQADNGAVPIYLPPVVAPVQHANVPYPIPYNEWSGAFSLVTTIAIQSCAVVVTTGLILFFGA